MGEWIAFALMNQPVAALEQSFLRTKTHDYASFLKVARLLPLLMASYDLLPAFDSLHAKLSGPIALLRAWDNRWAPDSKATSLAVLFGDVLVATSLQPSKAVGISVWDYMSDRTSDSLKLAALNSAVDRLTQDFGTWQVPWSEINRFQRNDSAIVQTFDDAKASIPVPFASAVWGSLASFGAKRYPGTKRYYGTSGNSFVATVEFGPAVQAWAVTARGASGHADSKHFVDQAQRYADGNLRAVYFSPAELKDHIERTYRPGMS